MKIKKEPIVLLVVIAVLSVYLVLHKTNRTHYQLPKVPDIAEKAISKIQIDKGAASVVLDKKGSGWEIAPQGFPADAEKVKRMLDILKNLTLTALVSEAKDYARYDLTEDKKVRVRAWASGNLKRDLDVGKTVPTYQHTFVKLAGDSRVYHARENFRDTFDQTAGDLRDKAVLSFDPGKIREISMVKGKASLVLTRKEVSGKTKTDQGSATKGSGPPKVESVWEDAGHKEVNRKELTDLLGNLSHLKCEKYLDGAKKDLKDPIFTISLKGEKAFQLTLFAKKEKEAKDYPAVSSENVYPFLLPDWSLEKIMKDPEGLLRKPVPEEKIPEKTGKKKG